MTRYLITAIFCLCTYGAANAQLITTSSSSRSGLTVQVLDSVSGGRMPRTSVMVASPRDTLRVMTDETGRAFFDTDRIRADSVEITVSHLGYETKKLKIKTPRQGSRQGSMDRNYYNILMAEKTLEMAEIVVTGDALAVVIKGDTVYYNASAFKTFEGDPMSKIFEKIPGMELGESGLTYMGELVSRVTIDGTRLFGDQVLLALDNIRADDVVGVEMYKEASDWDKLNEIENPQLQTVANVITKSKPKVIRNTTLIGAVGTTIDPDYSDKRVFLYDASGKLTYSRVGETLSANAERSDKRPSTGGGIVAGGGPARMDKSQTTVGSINYTRTEHNKYSISTTNGVRITKAPFEMWSVKEYFPTDNWTSRITRDQNLMENIRRYVDSRSLLSYTFKDKSSARLMLNLSYTQEQGKNADILSIMQNGSQIQSHNLHSRSKQNTYILRPTLYYNKKINSMITLNLDVGADLSENDGSGWRVDTLASSISQIHLSNGSDGWSRNYNASVGAYFIFTRQWSFNLTDRMSYTDSKTRSAWVDMLTGSVDLTNSRDFRIHESSNILRPSLNYRANNKEKGITSFIVGSQWEYKDMKRDNFFPKEYKIPRTFNLLNADISMDYKFLAFSSLSLSFSRISSTRSNTLDYMDLDDSNPTSLMAGNPYLKNETRNSASAKFKYIRKSATYDFNVSYSTTENSMVQNIRYFTQDTYLPEYDYTALAGSSLTTLENQNGTRIFRADANYHVRSSKLESIIKFGLSYLYRRLPVYVQSHLSMVTDDTYIASLDITGNFSSSFQPSMNWKTSYTEQNNVYNRNKRLYNELDFKLRLRIAQSIELNSTNIASWDIRWPKFSDMQRFVYVSNISLGYIFGKNQDFTLQVEVNDIFNNNNRLRFDTYDEYTSNSCIRYIGRFAMIRAEWKF